MKAAKNAQQIERQNALEALKMAILEGATWRYESLVATAVRTGVTDEEIDTVVHQALQILFSSAEQPVTPRILAQTWPAAHFRH
jgi:hypothetical protein